MVLLLVALVVQELFFGLALSSTAIPVNTCCPPRHFLAIEDWAESWQDPEGNWRTKDTPAKRALDYVGVESHGWGHLLRYRVETAGQRDMMERVYSDRHMSALFYNWSLKPRLFYSAKYDWDNPKRNDFISRVHCVADENNMPAIDGASADESKTLSEDQVLQSKGSQMEWCPPSQLSTIVLTKSGQTYFEYGGTRASVRLSDSGRLAGNHLDVLGFSNLPPTPTKLGNETELDVDFCITWNNDPRTKLAPPTTTTTTTERYSEEYYEEEAMEDGEEKEDSSHLLAVFCDPCKAKVICSFVTKAPWYALKGQYLDPPARQTEHLMENLGPRRGKRRFWWSAMLFDYFDADMDGKVTVQEFYDIKIVKLLQRIFDGLDKNNDGVVEKSEASLTSLLRPAFFRSLVEEFFPVADVNKDNFISMADVTLCGRSSCGPANTTLDVCDAFLPDYESVSCSKAFATYVPLVDTDGDGRLTLEEAQQPLIHLFQFLAGKPGRQILGIDQIVSGFEKLGEPSAISESLRQLLTPVLETYPRLFLQSLVASANKNGDNGMDFNEFEGFGDFGLIFEYAKIEPGEIWQGLGEALQSFSVCDDTTSSSSSSRRGTDKKCFPLKESNTELLFRYFSDPNVIFRLMNNLLFHEDFQFPAWNIQE